ncbi:hypothetical protein RHSP_81959 [Rhizobium freirei PRF 81]|uniref:Uncharacterized protein n=1 Tax=Rhizobium freirei PRF 81 TaxID=363754 RepID=N6V463_9HYPH|nr:hypothetical protein RHSP_81959 [Rhizobium freirei PRF 81]
MSGRAILRHAGNRFRAIQGQLAIGIYDEAAGILDEGLARPFVVGKRDRRTVGQMLPFQGCIELACTLVEPLCIRCFRQVGIETRGLPHFAVDIGDRRRHRPGKADDRAIDGDERQYGGTEIGQNCFCLCGVDLTQVAGAERALGEIAELPAGDHHGRRAAGRNAGDSLGGNGFIVAIEPVGDRYAEIFCVEGIDDLLEGLVGAPCAGNLDGRIG